MPASEMGVDMSRFPLDFHLANWVWVYPGNNESVGKRRADYREFEGDYFNRQYRERVQRHLIWRPERLGMKVSAEPLAVAV